MIKKKKNALIEKLKNRKTRKRDKKKMIRVTLRETKFILLFLIKSLRDFLTLATTQALDPWTNPSDNRKESSEVDAAL